jgi:hypothetical protein
MMFDPLPADADALRAKLTDPRPMERAIGLHALEVAVTGCTDAARVRLAAEAERFTARGIPFYRPDDRDFLAWVERAVGYWQRLQPAAVAEHRLAA